MNIDDLKIKEILLEERTTGERFRIDPDSVLPRYLKNQEIQQNRTKEKAEVFTPVEVVKRMNDMFDENFTGDEYDYINRKVLEVTCGEAPFLTTLYDASTGEKIPVENRVGLLDRKLAKIDTDCEEDWYDLAEIALQSTYGYEWQEDSLYIARRNVISAVYEAFVSEFGKEPDRLDEWAEIVSYNLFRMDGVTMCVPETEIPAKVMNWETGKMERFDGKYDEIPLW